MARRRQTDAGGQLIAAAIDPSFTLANRIEAGLWMAIALVLVVTSTQQRRVVRRQALAAACAFALFGVSDLVEATTGAWWRPWWLLLWKAGCILALLVLGIRYAMRGRDDHSS